MFKIIIAIALLLMTQVSYAADNSKRIEELKSEQSGLVKQIQDLNSKIQEFSQKVFMIQGAIDELSRKTVSG